MIHASRSKLSACFFNIIYIYMNMYVVAAQPPNKKEKTQPANVSF